MAPTSPGCWATRRRPGTGPARAQSQAVRPAHDRAETEPDDRRGRSPRAAVATALRIAGRLRGADSMSSDRSQNPGSQQTRKALEGAVVRRLTAGVGVAALGLAGAFTAAAASGLPAPAPAQPVADVRQPPPDDERDVEDQDVVMIRTVHVPAPPPAAGGVRADAGQPATNGSQAAAPTPGAATTWPAAARPPAPPPPAPA